MFSVSPSSYKKSFLLSEWSEQFSKGKSNYFLFSDPWQVFAVFVLVLFVSDPATKMWNFSLGDYRQLSKNTGPILMPFPVWTWPFMKGVEGVSSPFGCCSQWRRWPPSPPCLWGLWTGWTLSMSRPSLSVTAPLWGRCWSCAAAGRNLEPPCRASVSWCPGAGSRWRSATTLAS